MIKFEELQKEPEYWTTMIQLDLFSHVEKYMEDNNITRTELAQKLGVSKGYISQVLNGDYDHRLSKFVELTMAVDMIPQVTYIPKDKIFKQNVDCMQTSVKVEQIETDNSINYANDWSPVDTVELDIEQYSKTKGQLHYISAA